MKIVSQEIRIRGILYVRISPSSVQIASRTLSFRQVGSILRKIKSKEPVRLNVGLPLKILYYDNKIPRVLVGNKEFMLNEFSSIFKAYKIWRKQNVEEDMRVI